MIQPEKIKPRKTIQALNTAYATPSEGRREKIRLDFNENTSGFPHLYGQTPATLYTAYPEYQAFTEKLADTWGVSADQLLLTNGSDEALFLAALTFIEPGEDTSLTVTPTFGLIPHYLKLVGSELVEIPYRSDFQYDLAAIEQALKQQSIKLAIFASPDNPTGATIPADSILRWCQQYPHTLFVMDEAYYEYTGTSVLPLIHQCSNLLVTRTFSKAWGMAGLRLGVIAGASDLIQALSQARSPYSVNAMATATASSLLDKQAEIFQQAQETMARKKRVLEALKDRAYRVVEGKANFFLLHVGPGSDGFCKFFGEQNILLRDQSSRPLLQNLVRVSVGTEPEMERFIEVLEDIRTKRVLLFDMDGTLVDTRNSFDTTVLQLVKKHSGEPLTLETLSALRAEGGFNDDWEGIVELLRRRGIHKTYDDIAVEAQALYLSLAPDTETWLVDPHTLATLRKRYRLGVATGRYRKEFDPLWKERFDPLFETVVCQDDYPQCAKKPAPQLLQVALESLKATGGWYIGNSVDDMRAAKAAGLMALGVTTTHAAHTLIQAGADKVYESLEHLIGDLL